MTDFDYDGDGDIDDMDDAIELLLIAHGLGEPDYQEWLKDEDPEYYHQEYLPWLRQQQAGSAARGSDVVLGCLVVCGAFFLLLLVLNACS